MILHSSVGLGRPPLMSPDPLRSCEMDSPRYHISVEFCSVERLAKAQVRRHSDVPQIYSTTTRLILALHRSAGVGGDAEIPAALARPC